MDHEYWHPSYSSPFASSTYLDLAAQFGSIATIDLILKHGSNKANSLALHFACSPSARCMEETLAIMEHFIDMGFDVNGSDAIRGGHRMGTPLSYAVTFTSLPKIKLLLQHGADPHLSVGGRVPPFIMTEPGYMGHIESPELLPEVVRMFKELPPS